MVSLAQLFGTGAVKIHFVDSKRKALDALLVSEDSVGVGVKVAREYCFIPWHVIRMVSPTSLD